MSTLSPPVRNADDLGSGMPLEPAEVRSRLLPEAGRRTRLESASEAVGGTLGHAVSAVRGLPRRLTLIRGGAREKASQVADQASTKIDDLKVRTAATLDALKTDTRHRIRIAQNRSRQFIDDYPLQCLGGIFGVAFVSGLVLRIWRTRD